MSDGVRALREFCFKKLNFSNCSIFVHPGFPCLAIIKVVTDEASLRHEFRVSAGRNPRKSIKNPPLRHFACILRHNIAFLPVETRNSCLSEAASGTTVIATDIHIPGRNLLEMTS